MKTEMKRCELCGEVFLGFEDDIYCNECKAICEVKSTLEDIGLTNTNAYKFNEVKYLRKQAKNKIKKNYYHRYLVLYESINMAMQNDETVREDMVLFGSYKTKEQAIEVAKTISSDIIEVYDTKTGKLIKN